MLGILIGIMSSAVGLNIYAVVLLAKSKLNSIEVLFSKALIYSNTSHVEFILINNVLKEYDNLKKEIRNLKTSTVY